MHMMMLRCLSGRWVIFSHVDTAGCICGINGTFFQIECYTQIKRKKSMWHDNGRPHTLETTVVHVYGRGVRIIPHSPQFSLMSVSRLISMKIHLSTKGLYGLLWTMSLSWPLAGSFLSTKPPNWLHHVCNRPHSFDMDTSRAILQQIWSRIKWSGGCLQRQQCAPYIKEQWAWLGQNKK